MQDILLGGLATESNGKPLKSGGMIYLNEKNKKKINLNKPIKILSPTERVDKDMKLYKGEEQGDGKINWVDPTPLLPTPQSMVIDTGEVLFKRNCASCHAVNKVLTGPALAGMEERITDKKKLFDIIRNNIEVLKSGDPYYNCTINGKKFR
jgi:hypothetical protein